MSELHLLMVLFETNNDIWDKFSEQHQYQNIKKLHI